MILGGLPGKELPVFCAGSGYGASLCTLCSLVATALQADQSKYVVHVHVNKKELESSFPLLHPPSFSSSQGLEPPRANEAAGAADIHSQLGLVLGVQLRQL